MMLLIIGKNLMLEKRVSQSISKKSTEKRIKLFKELKRQEAERKKREKEEELFNKEH